MKRVIASNFLWLFGDRIYKNILNLFVGIWVARQIGPEHFGYYGLALTVFGILQVIVSYGCEHNLSARLSSENSEKRNIEYVLRLIKIKQRTSLWVALLYLPIVYINADSQAEGYCLAIIVISLFFSSYETIEYYYQSKYRNNIYIKIRLIAYTISAIIKLIAISLYPDSKTVATIYSLEIVLINLILKNRFFTECENIEKVEKYKINHKEHIKFMIGSLLTVLYMKADVLYVALKFDEKNQGIYISSVSLVSVLYIIPAIANSILIPYLSRLESKKRNVILVKIGLAYAAAGLFVQILIYLFSGTLIKMTYGQKFNEAINLIPTMSLAIVVCYMGIFNTMLISLRSLPGVNIVRAGVSLFLFMASVGYLGQTFGILGVVYASVVAYLASDVLIPFIYLTAWKKNESQK